MGLGSGARESGTALSSNRHPALAYCRSIIFCEHRDPLFGIMRLGGKRLVCEAGRRRRARTPACLSIHPITGPGYAGVGKTQRGRRENAQQEAVVGSAKNALWSSQNHIIVALPLDFRETAMRSAKLSLSAVLCSLAMLFVAAGEARSQTFDYVFCNKTNIKVFVAVATLVSPRDSRFKVQGWWTIQPNQCGNVGSFPRGWAYYYAEQDDPGTGFWGADDVGLCVTYPGPFERILTQNYTCGNNEVVQGFKGVFIEPNTGSMTVNLNPPR